MLINEGYGQKKMAGWLSPTRHFEELQKAF
jgi:hypothetical protein